MRFQQDGATYHTARETMAQLRRAFGEKLISRFGAANWPPRSCDLTPLDYFSWGYVKSLVYVDKPASIETLEANFHRMCFIHFLKKNLLKNHPLLFLLQLSCV